MSTVCDGLALRLETFAKKSWSCSKDLLSWFWLGLDLDTKVLALNDQNRENTPLPAILTFSFAIAALICVMRGVIGT
jgi:hypothetical protein